MSRGYGIRQRQIIELLENMQGYTETTTTIIEKIINKSQNECLKNAQGSECYPKIPLPRSIRNAFKRLDVRKVIIPSKTHNIYQIGSDTRPQQLPETYTLDIESEDYKKYRKTWSHA